MKLCGSMPEPFPLTSLADLTDGVTFVPFHPKHAQWVKYWVKLLAMVANQQKWNEGYAICQISQ
jgi:hypothetical protein